MPEITPLTKDQLFEKKIAENTGSDYNVGEISDVVPVTKDQALLKEIALNSAGQSGDITELEEKVADNTSAIEAIVNVTGACNILPFPYAESSKTDYEIQWTVNSDGTVRATGTNNHSTWRIFTFVAANTPMNKIFPCAGDYILKCIGTQSGTYNFDFNVMDGSTVVINENIPDGGKKYTITEEMLNYTCSLIIGIRDNISSSIDVTFKPMLYDARLNPSGYVSYAMTNAELTEKQPKKYSTVATSDAIGLIHTNIPSTKHVSSPCFGNYLPFPYTSGGAWHIAILDIDNGTGIVQRIPNAGPYDLEFIYWD